MLVGIDLGPQYTKIACRQDSDWQYRTAAPFKYETASSTPGEERALANYLLELGQEIGLNSMTSAAVSYPHYWNLSRRRTLYKACQAAWADRSISLLPSPVAALLGHGSTQNLDGDILVGELYENMASFSLLTVVQAGRDISLEMQLPLEYRQPLGQSLQDFITSHLQPRAKQLGFFAAGSWRLDAVILAGTESLLHQAASQIKSICTPRQLVVPEQADFQVARGLAEWAAGGNHCRVKAIYPFEFVLETFSPDSASHQFETLPFDTSNLAMDLNGRYLITTLITKSPDSTAAKQPEVHYRLWEKPGGYALDNNAEKHLIWEYRNPGTGSGEPLGVYCNIEKFVIESGRIGQVSIDKPAPYDPNSDYLKLAQRLLTIPFLNAQLKSDLQELASQPQEYGMAEQLVATRLRLLTFLQLFQPFSD